MALPKELEGKTPEEIAAYYETKIGEQKGFYEQALDRLGSGSDPEGNTTPPPPKKVTVGEFMADPEGSTRQMITEQSVSKAEWNAATQMARDNFIYLAEQRAKEKLKAEADKSGDTFDWERIKPLLSDLTSKMDPISLTNPDTWTSMYYYNRGRVLNTLRQEAVTRAMMPAESGTAGGSAPPPDIQLSPEQESVAVGFGLTADTYKTAMKGMKVHDLPLTRDNRGGRR